MDQNRRNILVVGGAGFIGSHICDELIKQHNVICVDNFSTGSLENISHLLQNPHFKFLRHDITEPLELESFSELVPLKVPYIGVHEVYNLACPTSPLHYNKYPIETLLANSHGTRNVLEIAAKYKAKVLHFSTSAIYGEPLEEGPFPEDYWGYIDPIGPRSCYNEGKRFAESLVVNYRNTYGIDAKIVRVFNTYGPRMKLTDGRMIPDLINQALQGKTVTILGDENDTSTFCYITDLIEGVFRVMRSRETGPLNLGSGEPVRLRAVAETVISIVGASIDISSEQGPAYTARQGAPDISKAKERLGWFPVVSLEEGLRQTIEYMRGSRAVGIDEVKV